MELTKYPLPRYGMPNAPCRVPQSHRYQARTVMIGLDAITGIRGRAPTDRNRKRGRSPLAHITASRFPKVVGSSPLRTARSSVVSGEIRPQATVELTMSRKWAGRRQINMPRYSL